MRTPRKDPTSDQKRMELEQEQNEDLQVVTPSSEGDTSPEVSDVNSVTREPVSKILVDAEGESPSLQFDAELFSLKEGETVSEFRERLARELLGSKIVSELGDEKFEGTISAVEMYGNESDDPLAYKGKRGAGQRTVPGTFDLVWARGWVVLLSTESSQTPSCVMIRGLLGQSEGPSKVSSILGIKKENVSMVKGTHVTEKNAPVQIFKGDFPEGYDVRSTSRKSGNTRDTEEKGLLCHRLVKVRRT